VTFTVTNESDTTDMGFSVWSVPEGTTADEILEDGIFTVVGGGPPADPEKGFYAALFAPTAIGTSQTLRVFLDTPGQHALNCYEGSTRGGPRNHVYRQRIATDRPLTGSAYRHICATCC
jgi:hypothetical protein